MTIFLALLLWFLARFETAPPPSGPVVAIAAPAPPVATPGDGPTTPHPAPPVPVCGAGEEWDGDVCMAVQLPGERSGR